MKNTNFLCPHTTTKLINKKETYMVKGESITIDAQVIICEECGQEVFVPNVDDENLLKAYNIYRKNHNLLSPEDIILLRKQYNLNQADFATLIGCSQNTIKRYENGAILDEKYNQILKELKQS
jgi:putative zinc finger/helix-turn-helix YgiT family protein